mgnify:CR=1 FL=1
MALFDRDGVDRFAMGDDRSDVSTTAIGPGPIMHVLVWWNVVPAVARTWFSRSSSVFATGPGIYSSVTNCCIPGVAKILRETFRPAPIVSFSACVA